MALHPVRTSNVEWCEGLTHAYRHSDHVAELANTASNLVFVVFGLWGLHIALHLQRPVAALVYTEVMLIVVGLGSMWFHARRSYVGEIMDELPMSLMAFGYLLSLNGLHWTTSGAARRWTYGFAALLGVVSWVAYAMFHNYDVFTGLFTVQVIMPELIS